MLDVDAIEARYAHYTRINPGTAVAHVRELIEEVRQLRRELHDANTAYARLNSFIGGDPANDHRE